MICNELIEKMETTSVHNITRAVYPIIGSYTLINQKGDKLWNANRKRPSASTPHRPPH